MLRPTVTRAMRMVTTHRRRPLPSPRGLITAVNHHPHHHHHHHDSRAFLPRHVHHRPQQTRTATTSTNSTQASPALSALPPPQLQSLLRRLSPLLQAAASTHAMLLVALNSPDATRSAAVRARHLAPVIAELDNLHALHTQIADTAQLRDDPTSEVDLRRLADDEIVNLHAAVPPSVHALLAALLSADVFSALSTSTPRPTVADDDEDDDEDDDDELSGQGYSETHTAARMQSALVEIRAGTGGDEAALFASDLVRMYTAFATYNAWKYVLVSHATTDLRGTREAVLRVTGAAVFTTLSREAGVHRVQRVPTTDTAGRVHTSTATVAVLRDAVADASSSSSRAPPTLCPTDVRVDVYRASGAGGQHVNTTESAVRATHIPTGLVATSQAERSQHRNRATALAVLSARVEDRKQAQRAQRRAAQRRMQLGVSVGERSERIRTYNFPQRRVTDHRVIVPDVLARELPALREALPARTAPLEAVLAGGARLAAVGEAVAAAEQLDAIAERVLLADRLHAQLRDTAPSTETHFLETLLTSAG